MYSPRRGNNLAKKGPEEALPPDNKSAVCFRVGQSLAWFQARCGNKAKAAKPAASAMPLLTAAFLWPNHHHTTQLASTADMVYLDSTPKASTAPTHSHRDQRMG